jgi:hypothetical protein
VPTRSRLIAATCVLAIVVWTAYRWWFDPERVITRRLHELAGLLSVPEREGDVDRLARLAQLTAFFTPDLQVRAGDAAPAIVSRDALLAAAATWRTTAGHSTVRVAESQVAVETERSAGARVTVELARRDGAGAEALDVHTLQLRLTHTDDRWRIAAADVGAAARPPD